MRFKDIPQLIGSDECYHITVGLNYFETTIQDYINDNGLILNPDFQRGHVWTEDQQIAYMEYLLRGGTSGRNLYFNKPDWHHTAQTGYNDFVCVDGLQRITAIRKFMGNHLKVFGYFLDDFEDKRTLRDYRMEIFVNSLQHKSDVLQWYIEMNEGGTPHTKTEIDRIKKMLYDCKEGE